MELENVEVILRQQDSLAWKTILESLASTFGEPKKVSFAEAQRREQAINEIDNVLSTAAWDLWRTLRDSVQRTSDALDEWWASNALGRAVLILDGLSLRELSPFLAGAESHGFVVEKSRMTVAETPGDTTPFATAIGAGQRSALENNKAPSGFRLKNAFTEASYLSWVDCCGLVGAQPNVFFWHHWPDKLMHDLDDDGSAFRKLVEDTNTQLMSDGFWAFVERLAKGRPLVITSDHGYAVSGNFPDVPDEHGKVLKEIFRSGRCASGGGDDSLALPPYYLSIEGNSRQVLGQRKWKSQGGYPRLTHGGLSLLEVFSPFVVIKAQG
jgi:hypothetical protein